MERKIKKRDKREKEKGGINKKTNGNKTWH